MFIYSCVNPSNIRCVGVLLMSATHAKHTITKNITNTLFILIRYTVNKNATDDYKTKNN